MAHFTVEGQLRMYGYANNLTVAINKSAESGRYFVRILTRDDLQRCERELASSSFPHETREEAVGAIKKMLDLVGETAADFYKKPVNGAWSEAVKKILEKIETDDCVCTRAD